MSRNYTDDPREDDLVWLFYDGNEEELDLDATPQGAQDWFASLSEWDQSGVVTAAWDELRDDAEWHYGQDGLDRMEQRGLI